MKKFGAMLGDEVEVGCGSVLNPGTVVGSHSNIYPLSSVRGFVPANSIYKNKSEVVEKYYTGKTDKPMWIKNRSVVKIWAYKGERKKRDEEDRIYRCGGSWENPWCVTL